MAIGILGRKVGMTQIYDEAGQVDPGDRHRGGPCHVLQVRTDERDGYEAVQLGFVDKPRRLASRSERGHVAKLDSKRSKKRCGAASSCSPRPIASRSGSSANSAARPANWPSAAKVNVEAFANVKAVDVTGTSKGRGYTGAMKRHNFTGQRATHGVKKCHRHSAAPAAARSQPRLQGQEDGRPIRQRQADHAKPEGGARRHGKQSAAGPRRGARARTAVTWSFSETNKL